MQYVQPYGISDPDAPYINGDPSIARQGSIPPAAAFEHPMRELVHIITDSLITPDSGDLEQCAKGMRSQRMNYVEDTGSVNTLSVALSPPLGFYSIGLPIRVKVANTCTGPSTIDAGAGRVPIRRPDGSDTASGDLVAFGLAELVYDGTVFQMINFHGSTLPSGPPTNNYYNIPYCVDTSPTANTVIANFSPAITSLAAGTIFMVKIANTNVDTNNGASNINVNGLGNKPIHALGGHPNFPFLPGDMQAGDVFVFIYDGTQFWIYPNPLIGLNTIMNISTVQQASDLFSALGRKRISTQAKLTIQLAAGIYGPGAPAGQPVGNPTIQTYHADADRIWLVGTMKPGQVPPGVGDFVKSGSSAGQIASDAAFNIQMLRARYASEIKFTNQQGFGLGHTGPGAVNYKNLLVTGPNVPSSGGSAGIGCAYGCSANCWGCTVWGSGDAGFDVASGTLYLSMCHANCCHGDGMVAGFGGAINAAGGGSYSNFNGIGCYYGSQFSSTTVDGTAGGAYFMSATNQSAGAVAQGLSSILMIYGYNIVNGSVDMMATVMGCVQSSYCTVTNWSPAPGTVGNLNSVAIIYA